MLSSIAWSPFLFSGRPFILRFLVNNAVCNVICTTVFGDRFDYGDETFKKLLEVFGNSLNEETGFLAQVNQEQNLFCRQLPLKALCCHDFCFLHHVVFSLSVSLVLTSQFLNVVPVLLRIPGVRKKLFGAQKAFMDYIDVLIAKHTESWDPDHTRDFTDVFLKEMKVG